MSTPSQLSQQARDEIDHWLQKYPPEQKQSALLQALTIVQAENGGYLTETLVEAVAEYLDIAKIVAYEAVSFYSLYHLKPQGKYQIDVCTNISCKLCGCDKILNHLQARLKINCGQTTADGRFTLRGVECLAACINAQ